MKRAFPGRVCLGALDLMHKDDAADEESTAKSWTLKWRDDE